MNSETLSDTGGSGPAIVMIHGWGQTRLSMEPLGEALKKNFRVITFDLAGHGAAKNEPGPYTFTRYCGDIARLVKKLSLGRFHLLGWSMGGTIAPLYCLDKAGPLPESLILLSSTPRFVAPAGNLGVGQHPAAVAKMERQIRSDPANGLKAFIELFFESGEKIDEKQRMELERILMPPGFPPARQALLDTLKELANTDLTGHTGEYSGNSLLIHGAMDKICPSGSQKLWNGRIERCVRVSLESTGHAPHLTRRQDVALYITQFISGIE